MPEIKKVKLKNIRGDYLIPHTGLESAIKWLGNRSNIFEVLPDQDPLNQNQYGKTTYIDADPSSFVRIPTSTWMENDSEIVDTVNEFSELLNIGSLIVDEQGTMGVVEEFEGDSSNYSRVVVTTIVAGNTDKIASAATSPEILGSYWFGKTKSDSEVEPPTAVNQSYFDFTSGKAYYSEDGQVWQETPDVIISQDIDSEIMITSRFWDTEEQENQHGGVARYNHLTKEWKFFPAMFEMSGGSGVGGGSGLKIGALVFTEEKQCPDYALWCDGSRVARFKYPTLYQKALREEINVVSAAEWEKRASKGRCSSFGLDEEKQEIILPLLHGTYFRAASEQEAGTDGEQSLPNITGSVGLTINDYNPSGSFYPITKNSPAAEKKEERLYDSGFNASLSSPIYKDGADVNPNHSNLRVYVVVKESSDITNSKLPLNPFDYGMYRWSEFESEKACWLKADGKWHSGKLYEGLYKWILKNIKEGVKNFKSGESHAFSNGTGNIWFPVRNPVVGATAYSTTDGTPLGVVSAVNDDGSVVVGGATYTFNGSGNAGESLFTDYDFRVNENDKTFKLPTNVLGASGNRIKGNEKTLGLKTRNDNAGLGSSSADNGVGISVKAYGQPVGSTATWNTFSGSTGITTDPDNSGMITAENDLYLYWYVGDTLSASDEINLDDLKNDIDLVKNEVLGKFQLVDSLPENPEPDVFYFIPE